ncbi:3885_t:CDS:1 [Funneliformis mosseae]|uniref:3885_t:CDS:1 n=1 Tax=Funneliformis mosseae TaxID=27381 RepID=A0A9N9DH64_FUNMO|nr:3885_t:CDS:1 [Funneliformis mosseae]
MLSLYDELNIEIFKHIPTPINLLVSSRKWHNISQDPHARAEWLIYKYGRAHAIFHAVRLGNGFITEKVIHLLLKKAILSRYLIQRLLKHFGIDEKLITLPYLKVVHNNIIQVDLDRYRAFHKKLPFPSLPWGSNLSLTNLTNLITEGFSLLNDQNILAKGNDMEYFRYLLGDPRFYRGPARLFRHEPNFNLVKDLILIKKFVPFPPRPKLKYEDTIDYVKLMKIRTREMYPPKDGYENNRQWNVVAKAILAHPDLITFWKEIGYHDICNDTNDFVMRSAFNMLFPPTPSDDWICPDVETVVARLQELIRLGFELSLDVIEEVLHSFELGHRLKAVGDLLLDSFQIVRKESKSDIALSCLTLAMRPERNSKKNDLLGFLIKRVDRQPEEALKAALDYHKVEFKLDAESIMTTKEIRSLTVNSNIYRWILRTYGPDSKATQKCFDDIVESRVWIDLKLQENPDREIPDRLSPRSFYSICSIYLEYCNEKVPIKASYLQYIQLAKSFEIIHPFFKISLPIIFGLQLEEFSLKVSYDYNRPEIILNHRAQINRQSNEINNIPRNHAERKYWFILLENIYYNIYQPNYADISENFKENLEYFWRRIHGHY